MSLIDSVFTSEAIFLHEVRVAVSVDTPGEKGFLGIARLDLGASLTEFFINEYQKKASTIMKASSKRSILRWAHLIFSVPIFGYVYSPFEQIPEYAPAVRYVFLPALVVTGLWLWKGHVVSRFLGRSATPQQAT